MMGTQKLQKFIKRNKRRNSHLYRDGLVINTDYVVCPVSKQRMTMIKSNYVEKILGMPFSTYMEKYPDQPLIAKNRIDNIKKGLAGIDPDTGLTKHAAAYKKRQQTMNEIGQDGKNIYERLGEKTRATHMSRVDENGLNGYQRQAQKRVTTVMENGLTIEQNAHIKQTETLLKRYGKVAPNSGSKESKETLQPIIEVLNELGVKYNYIETEYAVFDSKYNRYYLYDLVCTELSLCIEYQSNAWHPDFHILTDEIKWSAWKYPVKHKMTADTKMSYDIEKARCLFRTRNIRTFWVYPGNKENDLLCILEYIDEILTK
jgi:hypothetical protein